MLEVPTRIMVLIYCYFLFDVSMIWKYLLNLLMILFFIFSRLGQITNLTIHQISWEIYEIPILIIKVSGWRKKRYLCFLRDDEKYSNSNSSYRVDNKKSHPNGTYNTVLFPTTMWIFFSSKHWRITIRLILY